MSILTFTSVLLIGSVGAGLVGSLTGLGGGVVIVPLLVLVFHVNIRYAVGASLVSVIATSSGAAAAYVREGFSNIRIAMFLEIATTVGALAGAAIAGYVSASVIAGVFGVVLLYSAYMSRAAHSDLPEPPTIDRLALALRMNSSYPTATGLQPYRVHNVMGGFGLMAIAGTLSGLLGIGSGAVKVLAMDRVMHLPFKVSTTTSNFMIGVTAAASAGIYLRRGYIDPGLAMPVTLGVLTGAMIGARVLRHADVKVLRTVFVCVIVALAAEMLYSAFTGNLCC